MFLGAIVYLYPTKTYFMKQVFTVWASLFLFFGGTAQNVTLTQLVTGLNSPTGVYFAPGDDNTMYILQQGGRIRLADATTGVVSGTDFLNVTSKLTSSGNEQGLLGLAFHPDYANNGYFYINYTKSGGGATVVARYKRNALNPLIADLASEKIVLQVNQPYTNHNGGQLQFGADGYLYIGMGDGGNAGDPQNNSQNGQSRLGKMLRVDVDVDSGYAIPPTNPFVGNPAVFDEIWSLGLRNPWRFSFDMVTKDMWIADVGQNLWEEINVEPAGAGGLNYGWRCYEGNAAYNMSGCGLSADYTFPVAVYNHSGGNCSVTGGFVYRGGSYSDLYGKYIYADFCSGNFRLTYPNGSGGWTTNQISSSPVITNNIASFGQNNQGELYVVARSTGRIYKLEGTPCAAADIYTKSGSLESCTGSLELIAPYSALNSYQWFRNDTLLAETSNILTATISGTYKVIATNINNNCGNEKVAEVIIGNSDPAIISLPQNTFCDNGSPVNITVSPAGGILSGPGVNGLIFNPQGLNGPQQLNYTYTNEGCTQNGVFNLTVNPAPVVEFTTPIGLDPLCLNDELSLTGAPSGGTFSGPGVTGSTFYAGAAGPGTHTLTYSYTDANGCTKTATSPTITVGTCYTSISENELKEISLFPNPGKGMIQIQAGEVIVSVRVHSVTGAEVFSGKFQHRQISVDLLSLNPGAYSVKIESESGKSANHKLIIYQ